MFILLLRLREAQPDETKIAERSSLSCALSQHVQGVRGILDLTIENEANGAIYICYFVPI